MLRRLAIAEPQQLLVRHEMWVQRKQPEPKREAPTEDDYEENQVTRKVPRPPRVLVSLERGAHPARGCAYLLAPCPARVLVFGIGVLTPPHFCRHASASTRLISLAQTSHASSVSPHGARGLR